MQKRLLGRSGLSVSPLGLGTVELGMDYGLRVPHAYEKPTETDAIRIVHAALAHGINLIDTARAYGESERLSAEPCAAGASRSCLRRRSRPKAQMESPSAATT